ncbi:MAG: hypothetical protein K0S34_68 [Bacillales bacterium]|jgi:hypothetical protein|nr:hypothetical protein [Bacillales bacterium]
MYDYNELIAELKYDLDNGLINPGDPLKVIRTNDIVFINYRPIVEFFLYDVNVEDQVYEVMSAVNVLSEMESYNIGVKVIN